MGSMGLWFGITDYAMSFARHTTESMTIVLIGNFNPQLFQPAWFGAHKLIRQKEADSAKGILIHPQIARFETDWLELHVEFFRFQISTTKEDHFPVLRDLAVGVFSILSETPVSMLGMNMDSHIPLESEDEIQRIGDSLAPKNLWNGLIGSPGLGKMIMQGQRERKDETGVVTGAVNVRIERSGRINPGLRVNVNDHYQLVDESKSLLGAQNMIDVLVKQWDSSIECSRTIRKKLIERILQDAV